jgi:hypothetical protein
LLEEVNSDREIGFEEICHRCVFDEDERGMAFNELRFARGEMWRLHLQQQEFSGCFAQKEGS